MPDPSPTELELTPDLLDYARRVAFKEAQKRCRPGVDHDDAAQQALLHLIAKPPVWDPARGATPKSLVYTVIQRAVMKFAVRERKTVRFVQRIAHPLWSAVRTGVHGEEAA